MAGIGFGMLLGGLGLLLLGMLLMTDGLKQAAGPALGRLLSSSTRTRWRGLLSGVLVTAVVQSSSAVTIAAIGFVNAGLLTFRQSLWVLFGANVGTTMTSWLVALIGLSLKVEAAALPLIGLGMVLRLSGPEKRRAAVGTAMAGFGVLFLGIGYLQQAFAINGETLNLTGLGGHGAWSVLAFVGAGALLTVLVQSSSASMAVALTLAQSAGMPLPEAAAMVIGANIGTSVTAVLAALGATANAKRAASAHVLFNLMTALVALLLLPLLLASVTGLRDVLDLDATPAITLALFHSIFNVLGVLLMWPMTDHLVAFLKQRFRGHDETSGQPRYLDRNVASVPSLAADALRREMARLGGKAIAGARDQLGLVLGTATPLRPGNAYAELSRAVSSFVAEVNRSSMSSQTAEALATLLRVQHYYDSCHELQSGLRGARDAIVGLDDESLRSRTLTFVETSEGLLMQLDPSHTPFQLMEESQSEALEADYQSLKAALLVAGAEGRLPIERMDTLLRSFSALRRIIQQAAKAARLLAPGWSESIA